MSKFKNSSGLGISELIHEIWNWKFSKMFSSRTGHLVSKHKPQPRDLGLGFTELLHSAPGQALGFRSQNIGSGLNRHPETKFNFFNFLPTSTQDACDLHNPTQSVWRVIQLA